MAPWNSIGLRRRKPQTPPHGDSLCTPPTPDAKDPWRLSPSAKSDSVLSDHEHEAHTAVSTNGFRQQNTLDRLITERNRLVQRVLVLLKLATASKDTYFKQKKSEYVHAISRLDETKRTIEAYALSIVELAIAVREFAGNSNENRSMANDENGYFLRAAEALEEEAETFLELVRERVLRSIDDRVNELNSVTLLLAERIGLQIDVDYAKRMLNAAKHRGDVNLIATRQRALAITNHNCQEATERIAVLLHHHDDRHDVDIDMVLTEFACMARQLFRKGATLLQVAQDRTE